jgi:threonine/homoserine/homoserine lactone efflux protein
VNDLLPLLLTGVTLAVGYALVPGPVNAETTRRGVGSGFGPALGVQLGALAGDVPWAVLSLTGVALLVQGAMLSTLLGLTGAGFMILMARSAFRSAFGHAPRSKAAATGNGWRTGFMLSVANPGAIAFWTGVGGGALATSQATGAAGVWALVASYTVTSALIGAMLAGLAAWGQRWTRDALMRWIDGLCGLALTCCGANLLWGSIA